MKKLVVIAALLGLMFGMDALRSGTTASTTLTLAAIGFVLLAAFAVADLGARLKLPRVTGFILTGAVLGPSLVNILSAEVVVEMRMFNTLALGLIALGAGLEMDLRQVRAVLRTLLVTIAVKVLLGVTLIASMVYLAESYFHILGLETTAQRLTLSLVVGVLSLGTSPSIALAIMKETRAKGRMMDLALNAAVLKDVLVVVCLAAAMAVGRSLLGGGASQSSEILGLVARELGLSLLIGAAVGALLIAYLRFVKAEMLLFVAAMILSIAEVSRALHLELLLVFITAGFVVRNFSRHEEQLASAVSMVSLPVFVVFFTNAGAGLDLAATLAVLPLAAGLFVLRAGVYAAASQIGGRLGGEAPLLRRNAWLGYLPQAGVTLGLTTLAAERLPEVGPAILTTVMAAAALNLLVGPLTLRRVLTLAGETHDHEAEVPNLAVAPPDTLAAATGSNAPSLEDRFASLRTAQEDPRLEATVRAALEELDLLIDRVIATKLQPWGRSFGQSILSLVETPDVHDARRRAKSWTQQYRSTPDGERAALCSELFRELRACLRRAPEQLRLPLRESLALPQKGDRLSRRVAKRFAKLKRLARGERQATRTIPLRLLVRVHLEHRCAGLASCLLDSWCRTEAAMLVDLAAFTSRRTTSAETVLSITARLSSLPERFRADVEAAWSGGVAAMMDALLEIDSPAFAGKTPRLTSVEPAVRTALDRLNENSTAWQTLIEAAYDELALRIAVTQLEHTLTDSLRTSVLSPTRSALTDIVKSVSAVRGRFSGLIAELPSEAPVDPTLVQRLSARLLLVCDEQETRGLERAAARLRAAASAHRVAVEARAGVDTLPESLLLPLRFSQLHLCTSPKDVRTRRVNVRSRAQGVLLEQMLPNIDAELRCLNSLVALTSGRLREAVEIGHHALSTMSGEEPADPSLVRDAFARALAHLDGHVAALDETHSHAGASIKAELHRAVEELVDLAIASDAASASLSGWLERSSHRARALVEPSRVRLRELWNRLSEAWEHLQDSQFSQDLRRRVASTGLDASEIQAYLLGLAAPRDIPSDYLRLFALSPVHEHRMFVAYEAQLRAIVAAEHAWLAGGPGSALVLGAHGSGRTSLLNLCELETSAPRLLRPDPLLWRREVGLLPALAIDLGVAPTSEAVLDALAQVPSTVIVDDLEQWFSPSLPGLEQLEELLELIIASRGNAFWLVTAADSAAQVLSEAVGFEQAFAQVVHLGPLSAKEVRDAVERRHNLSGRRMKFSTTPLGRLASRLRRADESSIFFELLTHLTEGNLSRVFAAYLSSLHLETDGVIHPRLHLTIRIALPFLRAIPSGAIATLVHLCRFGPMSAAELSSSLYATLPLTQRHLSFLQASGLVEPVPSQAAVLRVPEAVRPFVLQGLKELGVY